MENVNFKVPFTKIIDIKLHNNAEKLELAFCYGFQLIVPKNKYQIGSKIIFAPVDSILPLNIESILFPATAKVKLHKGRVRQIKLRGEIAQGLIIDPEQLKGIVNFDYIKDEQDLSQILGITKYEPEPLQEQKVGKGKKGRKQLAHPAFTSYNGLTNLKWMPQAFEGKNVVVQCKLHGTNARAAMLPFRANTLMKKIKRLFGFAPEFEYLYGSNRVDITNSSSYSGFYNEDIYGAVFKRLDVFNKLKPNEIVFGEIIGPGIQKGYSYGLKEHTFVLFDVKTVKPDGTQEWMKPDLVEAYAKERGFEFVPVLYKGPYNLELVKQLATGPSVYCPEEPVREGCVVKVQDEYDIEGNKQGLKVINPDYLSDQTNTDLH